MEEMLCSPTVSSNSNVWMLYLCANDSDASSFKVRINRIVLYAVRRNYHGKMRKTAGD